MLMQPDTLSMRVVIHKVHNSVSRASAVTTKTQPERAQSKNLVTNYIYVNQHLYNQ